MTDDLDPTHALASAALDGDLTADERARLDASPDALAEMQRYAALRDAMADVEPPSADVREKSFAAALAAFDEIRAAAPAPEPTPVAPVVSLARHRRMQQRWIGAAAAVLVAVVAVGVLRNARGSSEDKSADAPASTTIAAAATTNAKTGATPDDGASSAQLPSAADSDASAAATAAAPEDVPVTTAASLPAPAPPAFDGDPWATAPSFTDDDAVRAYALAAGSPLNPTILSESGPAGGAATTAGATETTQAAADTTEAETAQTTGDTAVDASRDIDVLAQAYQLCGIAGLPYAPIVYDGERALLVRHDELDALQIIDPADCAVIRSIPLG